MRPHLTPTESTYFRLWSEACLAMGWNALPTKERDTKRHLAHRRMRCDDSHKNFILGEVDRVFCLFRSLADPTNLTLQIELDIYDSIPTARELARMPRYSRRDRDPGECRRLKKSITNNITLNYAAALAHDLFQTQDWEALCVGDLELLRDRAAQIGRRSVGASERGSVPEAGDAAEPPKDSITPSLHHSAAPDPVPF